MENENTGYAVAYARSAVKDNEAINRQQEKIREYCTDKNIKLLAAFNDVGSGSGINNMSGWIEMLSFLEQNKGLVSSLIVTDFDRISRNINAFLLQVKTLKDYYSLTVKTVTGQVSVDITNALIAFPPKVKQPQKKNHQRAKR